MGEICERCQLCSFHFQFSYPPGEPVNLNSVLDPHTVAGLLKYHFREWRVSIVPRGKPLEEITSAVRAKDVSTSTEML